jgi:apolipoprotein D and lipocalin family protein
MKKNQAKRWAFPLAIALGVGLVNVPAQASDQAVTSVAKVNLPQYAGTWYEIARFPMFFQRNCARDVTATYSLNPDATVKVDNRCVKSNGEQIGSVGQARAVDASNSQLKVTFLPSWLRWLPVGEGDYWILKLDLQYQTVLVGSPSRKYLWILSRQPQLDEQTYLSYVDAARKQGFDITQLQRTVQTPR